MKANNSHAWIPFVNNVITKHSNNLKVSMEATCQSVIS